MIPTPEEAYQLLQEYNTGDFHLKHGRIVGDCMRWFAEQLGHGEEKDFWETVGILHDLDGTDTDGQDMYILHADCLADAEFIRDEVKNAHPDMGEITISSLGVVIGAHCGPGLLAIFYLCSGRKAE